MYIRCLYTLEECNSDYNPRPPNLSFIRVATFGVNASIIHNILESGVCVSATATMVTIGHYD